MPATKPKPEAEDRSWVERVADSVTGYARQRKRADEKIVCASGISPSGPIHLGNLREVMTVHLVAEELTARGLPVEHIHSWDDYDRLRKVPAGVPETFSTHVGRPISRVPDPYGEYPSYADRYMADFTTSLNRLGVRPRFVRQSEAYRRGDYVDLIRVAMKRRTEIFDILAAFQTPGRHSDDLDTRRDAYYPFRPYCATCDRDTTVVTKYSEADDVVEYDCPSCGHHHRMSLSDRPLEGKLVWKVDWPMRWHFERVDFEPGGEDHSSPQGSYAVGKRIVREIFGGVEPYYVGYAFVGLSGGVSKMSSSTGVAATPATALEVLEPAIVRWLYARRKPEQSFSIDLGNSVQRLYDEWDQFLDKNESKSASEAEAHLAKISTAPTSGAIELTRVRAAFRVLASSADLTQGNREQITRITAAHLPEDLQTPDLAQRLEPRLTCAINWALGFIPEEERTKVRDEFSREAWDALSEETRAGIEQLVGQMDSDWTIDGLTHLLYNIPKRLKGLSDDAKPDAALKQSQRAFFVGLYQLICGSDTGPRMPTLFLSIGPERVRRLIRE
jgi:lysyl-tRNA synthetase class 1